MGKLKNLTKVAKKLKKQKWSRVRAIVRDYGFRELIRKVREKMRYGDAISNVDEYNGLLTNVSHLKIPEQAAGYECRREVSFLVRPAFHNVGRVDITTRCAAKDASFTLTIKDEDGNTLAAATEQAAADGHTVFRFLPVMRVIQKPLWFTIVSDTEGCGVLVHPRKSKHGFTVKGGGAVNCQIYARLDAAYLHWLHNNTPGEEEYTAQRARKFAYAPKISILVPLYNTPELFFRQMIDSVRAQTYANWELCLADGSSDSSFDLGAVAASYDDPRIRYQKLEENEGISGNSNAAAKMATGEYIALLDHDDLLMPQALYANVALLNEDRKYEFIYSDEDKITEDGTRRFDPFFKPDFSPDTFHAFNYITHFVVIKKSLLDEVGYFNSEYNGAQDYDLFLRATEKAQKVGHIPDILYHWRISQTSTAYSSGAKSYTVDAGKRALEASFRRRGISNAHVGLAQLDNYYITSYDIPAPQPMVSILIPNKDEPATLKKCIDSILSKTTYGNYEIIVVENNSTDPKIFAYYKALAQNPRIRVIEWEDAFNYSSINNYAARKAKGELLLFLNNDVSVISPDWLEQMVMHAVRPEIGAVGAKLYYPDDTIQHGGVIVGVGPVAGHSHRHLDRSSVGSFARMILPHNVSAVTAACLMTRTAVFEEVGGFDESFIVAYNDVDLCLKIREKGYLLLWTPFAELYHYESQTRGYDETPAQKQKAKAEARQFWDKWENRFTSDPFYNINLSRDLEDYSPNPDPFSPKTQ